MNLPRVILPLVVIASASLLALPSSANNAQAGKMVVLNVRVTDPDQLRRKVLILVTDSDDRSSFYTKDKVFRLLTSTDTQIFTIGFMTDLKPDQREKAIKLLGQLARETGGRTFFPRSAPDLERISTEIINDIRTQYVIGYVPAADSKNSFHKTVVSITQGANQEQRAAITRVGYGTAK